MKTLVVYYSKEGNTKKAAAEIAKQLSADILELKPIKDIPDGGLKMFMLGGMKAMFGWGTKLEKIDTPVMEYDRIILGTPIWAGKSTPAINQFLKTYDVRKKVVGLFTSAGGGDNDNCVKQMSKILENLDCHVALADSKNKELASQNEEKLNHFIQSLKA